MAPKPRFVVLFVLLGATCGAGLAWALRPSAEASSGDAVGRTAAPATPEAGLRVDPAAAEAEAADEASLTGGERAAAHLAEVTERNETLKASVTALQERVAALEPEAVEADPRAYRFGVQTTAPNFDQADWKDLAGHLLELSKVLVDIRDEVLAGGQPSAKSMQGVQKHNTPLGLFALSIGEEMGAEAHIAYTHPAVIANLIRSALLESGDPLARGQEVAIATLGDAWQRERDRQGQPASASALGKLVTEVEAKLRFLDDVKTVLTPSQRDLLFDPATEGRIQLDLLSPAWVFALRRPLGYADRAAMEAGLLASLLDLAEVKVEDTAPLAWAARAWVDEVPRAFEPRTGRSPEIVFPHVDDLLALARAQVRATERLVGTSLLTAEQKTALLGVTWVLHPFTTPSAPTAPEASD